MYVTQSYLGLIAKDAQLYVYLLTEPYKDCNQQRVHVNFLNRITEFGLGTGSEVAVVASHQGYEGQTLGEIRDNPSSGMQQFYRNNIYGETPGLLVTKRPVSETDAWRGAIFFSLAHIAHPVDESKQIVGNMSKAIEDSKFRAAILKLNSFVKLEPNIFGIGFNINKVIERMLGAHPD